MCFWSSDEAIAALKEAPYRCPGQVIVMRGAGACGGPAMGGGASRVVFAVDGAGLGDDVALLTDGHLSGLVCKGLVVAEVSPEAALGGPLGLLEDGDVITIDLDARRLDVSLDDAQLQARRDGWRPPPPAHDTGWLQQYRRNVGALSKGAVLVRSDRANWKGDRDATQNDPPRGRCRRHRARAAHRRELGRRGLSGARSRYA